MAFPFSIIPGVIGLLGSIFGKKKSAKNQTTYSPVQDALANEQRKRLYQMMASRMGQPTQAQGVGQDVIRAMQQQYFGPRQG